MARELGWLVGWLVGGGLVGGWLVGWLGFDWGLIGEGRKRVRRLKARNRPHGTHTHGGTSGINGHMGTSGGKPKALSAARNGNWELGGGSRMGMGWEGRGGEGRSPKAPPLSSSNPNSLPLPLPPRRRRRRRQQHFTSLHFTSLPTYRLLLGPGLGLLHRAGGLRGLRLHLLHFVGRWDAMVDAMGWDGREEYRMPGGRGE